LRKKVHVTALPIRFGQRLSDRALEAGVLVAGGQAHAVQAAFLEADEVVFPAGGAFAVSQLVREDVAAAVPADAQGDEHGAAVVDAVFAHAFVARVEDEVGILFVESAGHEAAEFFVEFFIDLAERGGAKLRGRRALR